MDDLDKNKKNSLPFLKREQGISDLPKTFDGDIFLFETTLAGTTDVMNIDKIDKALNIGEELSFYREPSNKSDSKAIRVENSSKEKIGYIPRQDNEIFSRLMDAGKILFGRVESKEIRGKWLRVIIKIYMHEIG